MSGSMETLLSYHFLHGRTDGRKGRIEIISPTSFKTVALTNRAQKRIDERDQKKYNSQFVGAVSDNAFWNSLKAKAAEISEFIGTSADT